MSDYPSSNDQITRDSLSDLQDRIGRQANDIPKERVGRASFGPDQLNDSVFYTARNFSINERLGYKAGRITGYNDFPETIRGVHWGVSPPVHDKVATKDSDPLTSIYHRQARRLWDRITPMSSLGTIASIAADDAENLDRVSEAVTTDDWSNSGLDPTQSSWIGFENLFGSRLFKISNQGRGYHLMFHQDINIAHSLDNDTTLSPKEWKRWLGGMRFWTSIIYVLRPSKDSKRVICWSPSHMIGASGSVVPKGSSPIPFSIKGLPEKEEQSNWASINITHSYTDIININDVMIKRLCDAHGFDFFEEKMQLKNDSYFGWATMSTLDRWDAVPKDGLTSAVKDYLAGSEGNMSYIHGQEIHVSGGSTNFIAFKYIDFDPEAKTNELGPKSSIYQYGKDPE
tara:strand:- start:2482 stop:3678 length:1197 start_codon:yes stop_codon:yes gene_type:complete